MFLARLRFWRNKVGETGHVQVLVLVEVEGESRRPWITCFTDCAINAITGVLMLFHSRFTGIEDPDHPANQFMGVGDLREAVWFDAFDNRSIRDPRRGFRR
ncbi:hypothetical protein [Streptomyces sp. NPDC045251]|uniref:hypothetical protein n=1 Tax=unclassified Streptomyces TaxID=2593676 RepID=UPI00340DEF95